MISQVVEVTNYMRNYVWVKVNQFLLETGTNRYCISKIVKSRG